MSDPVTIETLCDTLTQRSRETTFGCGGTVTAKDIGPVPNPLYILYEDQTGRFHQINFPASGNEVEALAANCQPATFGVLREEKLDIDYRSAWKLDKSHFLTSFHPAESDIMETIKQILFPGAVNNEPLQSFIVTELYKLNVCVSLLLPLADIHRYTKGLMTSSSLMSIPLAQRTSLDLSLFVYQVPT